VVDIFVSYARHDAQDAAEIAGKLHNEGHSVFVDADPDNGIPAGAEWRRTLFHELRICDAVIFLNSPAAQGSAWCHCELAVAAELGKQVYSLDLTRGIGPHPILSGRQGIPFAGSLDAGIQQLADRIGSEEWSRATRPRWDRTQGDFKIANRSHMITLSRRTGRASEVRRQPRWVQVNFSSRSRVARRWPSLFRDDDCFHTKINPKRRPSCVIFAFCLRPVKS
jgi:hypothetical protein